MFTPQPVFQHGDPAMGQIMSRLDNITVKLSTLNTMEKTMLDIKSQLTLVDGKVDRVHSELKSEMSVLRNSLRDIEDGVQGNCLSIEELTSNVAELKSSNSALKSQVLDLQSRSMRDNLLFYNIPEVAEEKCDEIVLEFCETKLKIEDAKTTIKLERAHRIGRKTTGKHRPIVAKFSFFQQRELVRHSSHNLQNTEFGVGEQFPKEVQDRRRELMPAFRRARAEGKRAVLSRDRLFIDGRPYTG
jgi:hypothetical protein